MCGVFGVIATKDRSPAITDEEAMRLRDLMKHRGPDDAGLWRGRNALLAHRRLSVVDLDCRARQPMQSACGRFHIVYNGELYNDASVRYELRRRGYPERGFRTNCDTETVLEAFACWGTDALARLRGMYAFAIWDSRENLLTLARDPLGVKPLYYHCGEHEITFASEPAPIATRSSISATPNLRMVSAYLTTIRTVLGGETLFRGISALEPGQVAQCSLAGRSPMMRIVDHYTDPPVSGEAPDEDESARLLRDALSESVAGHMRADVPICALLSGGLDSAAVTLLASRCTERLRTYCAGGSPGTRGDDLEMARLCADSLGVPHAQVALSERQGREAWPALVECLGVPLSTPNEIAIHAVAARLRSDGCIVTLSGEGADELLAGYEPPMRSALEFLQVNPDADARASGLFQLESNAWIPSTIKHAVLNETIWSSVERDDWLENVYERTFDRVMREAGPRAHPLDAHLRFHRRVNLTGLLQRLDSATMLASVEGRTPFSDAHIAALAATMPMDVKFAAAGSVGADQPQGGAGTAAAAPPHARTKIALRRAFCGDLPEAILRRPKASFPLPFESWLSAGTAALRECELARAMFTPAAIETVAASPRQHWRLAWPMMNIAFWARRWWD